MWTRAGKGKALTISLLLLAGAVAVAILAPTRGIANTLAQLWPILLLCAGLVRLVGFAVNRRPASTTLATLLIMSGALFLLSQLHSGPSLLAAYGKYWPVFLGIYAGVQIIGYYTRSPAEGSQGPFRFKQVLVAMVLASTGVAINLAGDRFHSTASWLDPANLVQLFGDGSVRGTSVFKDQHVIEPSVSAGSAITLSSGTADLTVTGGAPAFRATLSRQIRAEDEERARLIAERVRLIPEHVADGLKISILNEVTDYRAAPSVEIHLPHGVNLVVLESQGPVNISEVGGDVNVINARGKVRITGVNGNVTAAVNQSEVQVSKVTGSVSVGRASRIRISEVGGAVKIDSSHARVDLRRIAGKTTVEAPFSPITVDGLDSPAELVTQNSTIRISSASSVTVSAPHSTIRVDQLTGDLRVSGYNGRVVANGLAGDLTAEGGLLSVTARDIQGAVDVNTSNAEVGIREFRGPVKIRTSNKSVSLSSTFEQTGAIDVETTNGAVTVALPETSRFSLDASSAQGKLKLVGFDSAALEADPEFEADAPRVVRVRTSFKDITIQALSGGRTAVSVQRL